MPTITKVLVANRGEIAVRIARACADAGITSVAVYADTDRQALHVQLADEAFALDGARAADTYLDVDKLLDVARRSGADAVHPGYGFLSENAGFAQAVIDAGLVWIGPPPAAIESLGDKVSARHIAQRAGAPLVPGTKDPVADSSEVRAFAAEHGLPIAIKAAYGGGGRGLKVARSHDEIDELYDSAVREAVAAFGRGECFVERYLDKPRHVETQCLADSHGNVVVVSTRDCSLQRRHQKLVEEAPAPFLSPEQEAELDRASRAILTEAGYVGAGTCEFLVGTDGTLSFLEVNTRLQVEHPVTEEVTGIDLVREQLRIAAGEPLGYDTTTVRGHSLEFRINGEDPAAGFLPAPGTVSTLRWPSGPGVRVDTGVVEGDTVSGLFDSMIAKLIVTGATRTQAVERARRALRELEVAGIPTVVPFHRAVLESEDFVPRSADAPFRVHTRWIETDFADAVAALGPADPPMAEAAAEGPEEPPERVVVEVGGRRLEVVLPAGLGMGRAGGAGKSARRPARRTARGGGGPAAGGTTLASPMQGTIVKVAVAEGDEVAEGDLVVVLEAMKMEQPITAHRAGTIKSLTLAAGAGVTAGTAICEIA
ncbi:acetyl-CoA/propionyl-CoA carboxylase, biotin carboxylase, biotin carboxyl carrier protein [Isoptericola sp. CG 20/1183]|uniref:biotin carboxylase n=1 Tax=Isoptericola halotolerans TaxID=300560 RepID=A0ABX5EF28_9MICO|nr:MULTISPECIES: biotin carboxylase N-terminal domain-containing protein [Isoptericola]PRZ07710.1 acetyl-CoA/propionyl-CoA carboxylase, biotin carboxylase, biotin carboxyl carrier protein [Isoptericola halotolerans]PRZ07931.1 acetyl-CoA/propionyl-CoA carboxylase, biotin carboxylase, biotin carboxyl carrier protein [Isoptericola sp. CG 20/1183]